MAAMKAQLLGPPKLQHPFQQQAPNLNSDSIITLPVIHPTSSSPSTINLPSNQPLMGRTENFSPTFLSSGNPCIDFFFHIVPDTPPETLTQRLELAWKHDPLTTLKLVCNLRGVRGTGKSDKEGFYASALWLHKYHPKTLAGNLKWFADFGYFKDLPEILFRLLEGLDVRKKAKAERPRKQRFGRRKGLDSRGMKRMKRAMADDDEKKKDEETTVDTKKSKKEKNIEKGKKALERYCTDQDYRYLHDRISDLFAEYLISDLKLLTSGEVKQISLASKWCPNLNSSFDRATLLCESIARRVFPLEKYPEYQGIEDAHYAYRVRDRLRKQYLVPLHKALEIPEVYLCSKRWSSLPYNRVPSIAMKNYKSFFEKHDEERFKQYLEKVKSGKATIAAGALLPHEIIASLECVSEDDDNKDKNDVAELQWRRMVKDITEKGKLRDCLAICDVSGSMWGTPMEVCVALGLLVSEMNEDPWKGKVITFSHNPHLHKIEGEDLYSKTNFIREMDCGGNTDFQKVFDLILQVAINGKLREDQMIKRLFVFSDMEFDEASYHSNKVSHKNYESSDTESDKMSDKNNENSDMASDEASYSSSSSDENNENNNWETDKMSDKNNENSDMESESSDDISDSMSDENNENNENNWETNKMSDKNNENSDMESESSSDDISDSMSDENNENNWETDYEAIKRKYQESGYGNSVPQIVFWNLRDSRATPVMGEQKGVALVSGFSKNLLTLFLDGMENMTPTYVMEMAISGEEYQQLLWAIGVSCCDGSYVGIAGKVTSKPVNHTDCWVDVEDSFGRG